MTFKTLLCVHHTHDSTDYLLSAIALAKAMDARLNVLVLSVVTPVRALVEQPDTGPDWHNVYTDVMTKNAAQAERIRALLAAESIDSFVKAQILEVGMIDRVVARAALYADLTLLDSHATIRSGELARAMEGILEQSGRPALVLGHAGAKLPPKRVMIAWNGSPEVARAVQFSLPLLIDADSIHLVSVAGGPESNTRMLEDKAMVGYFHRHGLEAEVEHLESSKSTTASTLVDRAGELQADLVVMGAYGHSRLREWFVPGSIRTALDKLEVPLFVSH